VNIHVKKPKSAVLYNSIIHFFQLKFLKSDLDKIIKELTPVQVVNSPDFNPILLDQSDERTSVSASRLLNNYRWCNKLQECINSTSLTTYKRFQQTYAERKSPKYRTYNVRPFKKECVIFIFL
jgi:hypothetical protein